MIREIYSFDEYEGFIRELAAHPLYSDPHFTYDKDNLYHSLKAKDKYAFAVSENGTTEGLFVWIVLPDDRYIEMLIGFTRKEEAFREMLSYMERNYSGYQMDFVFNPLNAAISRPLKRKGAIFDPEQQKMLLTGPSPNVSTSQIELLSEKWTKQYCDLHNVDTYWTAERILSAQDSFRVLLAIKDGQVQGYLDVQYCYEINEIYDLFVKPEAAEQGYELALLGKAIELNKPHQIMVVVDVDAKAEIELYTAAGFKRMEGQNSITASYQAREETFWGRSMKKTFIEMKLFQVKPDRLEQFEAKIEEMSANQFQCEGCLSLKYFKRFYTIDGIEPGEAPRELTRIVKCVKYFSTWEFDTKENYGKAIKFFFENYNKDLQKLLIAPFDINIGYSV